MSNKRHAGFTLVEMIIAIVILGIALAGTLLVLGTAARSSADPLLRKQMLAVAEEMLEEIQLKPYAVSGTPPGNGATTCGSLLAARGAFDDVRDYDAYRTTGICDIDGAAVAGLESYNLSVTVGSQTWQGIPNALRISVTVTHGGESFTLDGWRTGYAL